MAANILLRRLASGRFDSWSEYLCVEAEADGSLVLSVCGWEVLAEAPSEEEEDEDAEPVTGEREGDYIVGDTLVPITDDDVLVIEPGRDGAEASLQEAREWLQGENWDQEAGFAAAWRTVQKLIRALAKRVLAGKASAAEAGLSDSRVQSSLPNRTGGAAGPSRGSAQLCERRARSGARCRPRARRKAAAPAGPVRDSAGS